MRVVVVGASGNSGTSLLTALASDPDVTSILGVARRLPALEWPRTDWARADIAADDLVPLFRGADAIVHLAWLIQPSHDGKRLHETNVEGSSRVFRAVAEARVRVLVYASSVGAYSAGPKDRAVTESWPTDGIGSSFYARHKAEVEHRLDRFEREHVGIRVVRLRPGLLFKREAASGIRRLFAGPFLVNPLLRPALFRVVPDIPGLRFQAVHTDDVAEAYRLALVKEVSGAFNVAAEPVLDPPELARILGARRMPFPAAAARALTRVSWKLHLQPTPPGWLDLARSVPILDTSRARAELGWSPKRGADEALLELLSGIKEGDGLETPPLTNRRSRAEEVVTGIGSSERP
jgi:UDP-glucose 4-epimerase